MAGLALVGNIANDQSAQAGFDKPEHNNPNAASLASTVVVGENNQPAFKTSLPSYESELMNIINLVKSGNFDLAQQAIIEHLQRYPKSRVAHLIQADLLALQTGAVIGDQPTFASFKLEAKEGFDIEGLRAQLRDRWSHQSSAQASAAHTLLPSNLLHWGEKQHVLVADMHNARLYVYALDAELPRLVSDYYLTVGSAGFGKEIEGDNKTPIGVYHVTSFLHPDTLPDLYGSGAFPVNYPNTYDRAKRRTGYGIWLHGTPSDTYARAPWASEGCFVVSNEDFEHIQQYIDVNERTPVILAESIEWLTKEEFTAQREEYLGLVERWRETWESLDTEAYLAFYAQDEFNFGRADFAPWAQRKRIVNANKTFVQVSLDIQGMYLYPGEEDLLVVQFEQLYLSNNYSGKSTKQQFWRKQADGEWRIVYEG